LTLNRKKSTGNSAHPYGVNTVDSAKENARLQNCLYLETLGLGFGSNQTVGVYRAGAPERHLSVCGDKKLFAYFLEPLAPVFRVDNNVYRRRKAPLSNGTSMEMTGFFWLATIVMVVVALGFVALPLLKNNRRNVVLAVVVALPLVAAGLYMKLGSPTASMVSATTTRSGRAPENEGSSATSEKLGSVASMVEGLARRLETNPEDGDSWLLLARAYKHLNRIEDATSAYERATALGRVDADLAALGSEKAVETTVDAQIFGNVSLSSAAKEIVRPSDIIFIFARAVDGPPMPVAVLQRPATDLPIDFLLNDSQSMTAGMELSKFEQVIVTARVTRKGDAMTALQGLEATSETIRVADNRHLDLIIE
jgi:hypothetical protein